MTPEQLLATNRGLVVAPAGCGKTYLLTETVKANTRGRVLVLTHTRAGVGVIRNRLAKADPSSYRVDTLDHWAAWIALRFPATSGYIPTNTPNDYDLSKKSRRPSSGRQTDTGITRCGPIAKSSSMNIKLGRLQHQMVQGLASANRGTRRSDATCIRVPRSACRLAGSRRIFRVQSASLIRRMGGIRPENKRLALQFSINEKILGSSGQLICGQAHRT